MRFEARRGWFGEYGWSEIGFWKWLELWFRSNFTEWDDPYSIRIRSERR